MFRFARRYKVLTAVVAIVAFGVFAVAAWADAPDATQTVNYSNLGFAPNQMSVSSIVYDPLGDGGLGTTTLTVKGGWAWPTHGSDCNTDRAGAGYAIDWYDVNDAGYAIGNTGISVGSQNPNGFAGNTDGNVVQPTPSANDPSNPATVTSVSSPSSYASWRGGCGKVSTGTVTGWQGGGNPPTSFSQGFFGPISHTYVGSPSDLPSKVCAITYDVHPGTTAENGTNGLGIPSNASEITAGGNGANGDNSIQGNGKTPAGNTCTAILIPQLQIVKTPDAAQVNAGQSIGFTLTVSNTGAGDATGVTISDPLPTNPGLSWSIDTSGTNPGAGWNNTCAIDVSGTLNCGGVNGVTVPAGTTQGASTFTVHVTSDTTAATGGGCPGGSGVVNNTGTVNSTNAGSGSSQASTCVAITDLQITKKGSPATQDVLAGNPYKNITWTMVVTNNGPSADTNVQVGDPIPAGNNYVSSYIDPADGSCTFASSTLNCSLGTMQVGASVTITFVTTPTTTGQQTNTAQVAGDLPETDTTNNQATANVVVNSHSVPPKLCTALLVKPKQLYAGKPTTMHITVKNGIKPVSGVRVEITGPGVHFITHPSNSHGKITTKITVKKAGIVTFRPVANKSCKLTRAGVAGVNISLTG